jgi:hypothetical protein
MSKSAAYSFGGKTGSSLDTGKNKHVPGPGAYNLYGAIGLKYAGNTSQSGFGTSKR